MIKKTKNTHAFNSLIENRWSTRAFKPTKVEQGKINSILEAATWAPSAFNEQPWRFIVGKKGGETYDKILETLIEWNQKWASNADVLVLNITKRNFAHNNKPNATFEYDLGQAVAFMALEVVNQGLYSHQMSGFDPKLVAELFNINNEFKVVSVIAIGYYGNIDELPKDMIDAEKATRNRKAFDSLVFEEGFIEK